MTSAFVFALALVAGAPTDAKPDPVSGFHCGTPYAVKTDWQLELAYGARSLAIIDASLANDMNKLDLFVAPDAKTLSYSHDVRINGANGPRGVRALLRSVAPKRFEFFQERGLPPPRDPCGKVSSKAMLEGLPDGSGVVATFDYDHGVLIAVSAEDADYIAREFRRPHR